jgi:hypothetical protein
MGHIAINFPHSKDQVRNGKYKRHHAHVAEYDEPDQKRVKENYSSEEYVLILDLTGTITHKSDTFLLIVVLLGTSQVTRIPSQNSFRRIHLTR